ncbi:unnamed protein product [Ectocarpus sp. 13 AM-2016]
MQPHSSRSNNVPEGQGPQDDHEQDCTYTVQQPTRILPKDHRSADVHGGGVPDVDGKALNKRAIDATSTIDSDRTPTFYHRRRHSFDPENGTMGVGGNGCAQLDTSTSSPIEAKMDARKRIAGPAYCSTTSESAA